MMELQDPRLPLSGLPWQSKLFIWSPFICYSLAVTYLRLNTVLAVSVYPPGRCGLFWYGTSKGSKADWFPEETKDAAWTSVTYCINNPLLRQTELLQHQHVIQIIKQLPIIYFKILTRMILQLLSFSFLGLWTMRCKSILICRMCSSRSKRKIGQNGNG